MNTPSDPLSTAAERARSPRFWRVFDWLFCLSAANIFFYRTWTALLEHKNVVPISFAMVMLDVLLLAVCLRLGYFLVQTTRSALIRWAGILLFAVMWLIPVHALTTVHFADDVPKRNFTYLLGLVLVIGIVVSPKLRHGMVKLCVMLVLFVTVTFGQSLWRIWSYNPAEWALPVVPAAGAPRMPRLVWLLFDEWDYGLTFAARRPGLSVPEVDRLVNESFHATKAHPPEHTTSKSVPRLLTDDASATLANLHSLPSVFSRAKQDGLHSAAVSWFVDYCGDFAESLDACWSAHSDAERNSMGSTAGEMAVNDVRYLFENQFRSPFGQPMGAKRHALDYKFNLRSALQATTSPAYDFVYVHFNIPHEPLFYDASTGRYDLGEKPITSMFKKDFTRYLDAVRLVDRTIGELRRGMEASGVWDNTHVLITSDHPYRARRRVDGVEDDFRVPFIVKRPAPAKTSRTKPTSIPWLQPTLPPRCCAAKYGQRQTYERG